MSKISILGGLEVVKKFPVVGGWVPTHNLVKPTLLVKIELGFDNKFEGGIGQ